jgi:hypothetical protein
MIQAYFIKTTLRGNWNNENSHMAYIIGLMATKDNVPILDADVVDINTTFSIVNDFDESKTYTIVDSPDLSFNEIGLDRVLKSGACS